MTHENGVEILQLLFSLPYVFEHQFVNLPYLADIPCHYPNVQLASPALFVTCRLRSSAYTSERNAKTWGTPDTCLAATRIVQGHMEIRRSSRGVFNIRRLVVTATRFKAALVCTVMSLIAASREAHAGHVVRQMNWAGQGSLEICSLARMDVVRI